MRNTRSRSAVTSRSSRTASAPPSDPPIPRSIPVLAATHESVTTARLQWVAGRNRPQVRANEVSLGRTPGGSSDVPSGLAMLGLVCCCGTGVGLIGSWLRLSGECSVPHRGVPGFWVVACAVLFVGQVPFAAVAAAESAADEPDGRDSVFGSAGSTPGLPSEPFADPVVGRVPDAPVEPSPEANFDKNAKVGDEVVSERSEFVQAFRRSDGLLEVRVSPERVAFDAGDGDFELIDTAVRAGRDGVLVADRNSFEVSFDGSDSGVSLVLPTGRTIRSVPLSMDGVAPGEVVEPVVDDSDDSVVWYRQVWPGVDLRYRVTAEGLSEDVVYTRAPDGAGAVSFDVSGVELDPVWMEPATGDAAVVDNKTATPPPDRKVTPAETLVAGDLTDASSKGRSVGDGVRVFADAERPSPSARAGVVARGDVGKEVSFGPVVALSGKAEQPVLDPAAAPLVRSSVSGDGGSVVEVSVDPAWLASQPADAFPVVLDPDVVVFSNGYRSYLNVLGTECGSGSPWCWVRFGVSGDLWVSLFGVAQRVDV